MSSRNSEAGDVGGAILGSRVAPITQLMSDYYKIDNPKINGIKYSHVGSRHGLGSMMDSELIQENLDRQRKLIGQGYVKLAKLDSEGNIVKNSSTMNIGGRLVASDESGSFTIIDSKALQVVKERELERRAYIEQVTADASLSDEICAMTCGLTVQLLKDDIGPNGNFNRFNGMNLEASIIGVDAMPSAIASYDPNSQTYSSAIRKLKMYIENKAPVLDNLTDEKTLKHGDENTG